MICMMKAGLMPGNMEEEKNVIINPDSVSDESSSWDGSDSYIKTANAKVLLNTLAPQISGNEEKKREHKDKLIKYVSIFLGTQFLIIFILTMLIIISIIVFHAIGKDFSATMLQMIFTFFGTYITSVIVELICILKYIIINVFDTSVSALMEAFKMQNDDKNIEKDNKEHDSKGGCEKMELI